MRASDFGKLAKGISLVVVLAACGQGASGPVVIEEGQAPVIIFRTVEETQAAREADRNFLSAAGASNLTYHGGRVETAPAVYLVFWGRQWSNDPSGEAPLLQKFFNGVGGSAWANIDTQYTSNVGNAGNQSGELKGVWFDNAANAPRSPSQSQLAGEATRAASHFSSSGNINAQYIIATSHGNNARGFGSQYCAWHSATGNLSYTNLPYITDAGASCGANFNGLGPNAGITIVAGHEYAETVTDPFPSSGWVDSSGAEIGDKCAWTAGTSDITLSTGTFPVQPLWSNAVSGCALHYP